MIKKLTSNFLILISKAIVIFPAFILNGCVFSDEAILNKAYEKFELGYYESAIEDFDKVIKSNPKYDEAYLYRGISNYYLDNIWNAKSDLNKSNDCKASYYLGLISLFNDKDTASATTYFTTASVLYGKDTYTLARASYFLGKLQYGLMQSVSYKSDKYFEHRDEAMNNFNRSIKAEKYYEWGFLGKGMIHYSDGYYDSAYNDVSMAIILNNKLSWAYYFRALCEKKLNGNQQAICDDYKKAIKYQEAEGEKIIDSAGLGEVCR